MSVRVCVCGIQNRPERAVREFIFFVCLKMQGSWCEMEKGVKNESGI